MRILLVRHGESLGNVDPRVHATTADHAVPLSDRGHQQASEAGARLADYFDQHVQGERPHIRLWVSPYHRTRQTADRLVETARGWITDRVEHILLCEQQFGLFDGVAEPELPRRFPNEWAYYDMQCRFGGKFWARMPQGESRFDVAKRIHQAFGTFHRDALEHGIHDIVVIIGVNMALPVIEVAGEAMFDELMMPLSLALAERCDAVLRVGGPSLGADQEVERVRARGGAVYTSLTEIRAS